MNIEMRAIKVEERWIALEILNDAREHQKEQGFVQWTDDYPNMDTVLEDIKMKRGYIFMCDGTPIGYASIESVDEPGYRTIKGEWKSNKEYVVVHRLAIGYKARGKGVSKDVFRIIKEMCIAKGVGSIRIDTHEDNKKMQHVVEREGYEYCGIVTLDCGLRMAYELVL